MTIGLHTLYLMNDTTQSLLLHYIGLRVLRPIKIKLILKWCLTLKKYAPWPPTQPKSVRCYFLLFL